MKVRGMMPQLHRLILHPLTGKVFVCLLAGAYLIYLVAMGRFLSVSLSAPSEAISEHVVGTTGAVAIKYWTVASMRDAPDADLLTSQASDLTQGSIDTSAGKAAQQQGQLPRDEGLSYPLSTVGKLFLTSATGQNLACSGTAVASLNQSVVDTAGHCLYWQGGWIQNVIFCPLYTNVTGPYVCWAAPHLKLPSCWLCAMLN